MILCECNSPDCMAGVPITTADYMTATVRSRGELAYVVVPGHVSETDRIIETHEDYVIVR